MTPITLQDWKLTPAIDFWPDDDRSMFLARVGTGRGPFQRPRSVRSPHTLDKVRRSYARYLRYLSDTCQLYKEERCFNRATPDRLDGYLQHLRDRGQADRTIWGLFEELRTALHLMQPKLDFRWIVKPQGVPLREILPMQTKTVVTMDSRILLAWAEERFAESLAHPTAARRRIGVRNAVILGLLAERAPRLRSLSMLRLGDSLRRDEDAGWNLREAPDMTKTGQAHYIPLSGRLARMLDRYVDFERGELLGSQIGTSAAWVNSSGELRATGLQSMVFKAFMRRFGERHGPHFFRHCLATTLADQLPEYPLDASIVLAHAPATTIKFYNHSNRVSCARRFDALLASFRPGFKPT